ncbi:MAG: hypothetical protein ACKO69_05950 [Limnohabitans sp.]
MATVTTSIAKMVGGNERSPAIGACMKVKEILSDVQLVIAQLEVDLNGEPRTSPTLCALIPAEGSEPEKIIPLNTPDGRPIFMNIENVIRLEKCSK